MASASTSKQYKLAVQIAGQVSSSFNSAMGEAGNKLTNLGTVAKRAAAVAAAAWGALQLGQFISDAVETFGTFEQSMANTAAIAGATSEDYARLEEAALAMGKATTKTAAEAADALGYMALAGWKVDDAISSLEPILRLSEATQMDLARCSDLVTDSMSALGVEVSDLSRYLDIAAQANNKSNQTAEMLMEAYIGVGGTMKNLGVPLEESAAALGVLANRGIKGSEAGTALNAVMVNLTTGTGQAGEMMEKLGISAFDSSGQFIGLEETLRLVSKATANLTEEEQNAALAAIGGKMHIDSLNALLSGLNTTTADGVTEWAALTDALKNSDGALSTMAATMTDTMQGAKAILNSAIDDMKINIVSTFAPYAKDAINAVANTLPRITEAVLPAAQSFVEYAIPKIVAFKDKAVQVFNSLRPALENFGTAAMNIINLVKPIFTYLIGTALPAIGEALLPIINKLSELAVKITENKALVIALVSAYAGFKGITALSDLGTKISNTTKVLEAFQAVTKGTSLTTAAINGQLPATSTLVGVLTGKIKLAELAAGGFKAKLAGFTGGLTTIGTTAKTVFTSLGTTIASLGSKLLGLVTAHPIVAAITAVIAIVVTLYNKCEWFRDAVDAIIAAVVNFVKNTAKAIAGFFTNLWESIKSVWQAVSGWFKANVIDPLVNFFTPIIETVSGIFEGCWIIIQAVWVTVSNWFQTNVITPVVNFFSAIPGAVGGFFSSLWSGIQSIWATVSGWFQTNVITPLVNFFAPIVETISGFFSNLWSGIVTVWQAAGEWFQTNVATPISNAFQTVSDFVKGIFNGLLGFVEGLLNGIIGAINNFVGGFSNVVEKAADVIGIEWDGIPEIPAVSLPRMAEGGIVTAPTILEAGEAGTEAIIPLSELWGQMQDMIANSIGGVTSVIASLAERLDAAEIGNGATPISDLLGKLGGGSDDDGGDPLPADGPVYHIVYNPEYHFEGGPPSRDDLTEAESISQEEFNRKMARWVKDNARKRF